MPKLSQFVIIFLWKDSLDYSTEEYTPKIPFVFLFHLFWLKFNEYSEPKRKKPIPSERFGTSCSFPLGWLQCYDERVGSELENTVDPGHKFICSYSWVDCKRFLHCRDYKLLKFKQLALEWSEFSIFIDQGMHNVNCHEKVIQLRDQLQWGRAVEKVKLWHENINMTQNIFNVAYMFFVFHLSSGMSECLHY